MATNTPISDVEKAPTRDTRDTGPNFVTFESFSNMSTAAKFKAWIMRSRAFEFRGIQPVELEDRTDKRYVNIFTFWVAMTLSVLPIIFGMLGPLSFGLSLRNSSLVILFFSMLCGLPCAYLATLGPKTGLRQMSLARYSFGYYPVSIPILLNLATLVGYCVVTDVIGGEILAALAPNRLSWTVGILIVGIIACIIAAMGYKVLHLYERFSWIVSLICLIIVACSGGKHLHQQSAFPPPAASTVMSFGAVMAGYYLPWAAISSDFSAYISPEASPKRIFLYAYAGLIGPSVILLIFGAAIGGATPNVPSWAAGNDSGSTGEVLSAVLSPLGNFGKFILALLSLTVVGNLAGTVYAVTLNFQALLPLFTHVPRVVYATITTIITIPVAVKAAESFFASLEDFTGIIGYWSASWVAVILIEHFYFRKGDATAYDIAIWGNRKALPLGIAAIAASALSMALAIPSMSQVWYIGPIGHRTGDIGFELAFAATSLLYFPFRHLEIKLTRRL